MTEAEFHRQRRELVKGVPGELHDTLSSMAWEESHAYGYEEVLATLNALVERFAPCIRNLTERLAGVNLN